MRKVLARAVQTEWDRQRAEILAEYEAVIAKLPVSDEPFPDLEEPYPTHAIHTRRDTKGNVYGYFPGCKSEGMFGWVSDR